MYLFNSGNQTRTAWKNRIIKKIEKVESNDRVQKFMTDVYNDVNDFISFDVNDW